MKAHLLPTDYAIFKRYISQSKNYFEYGSGGSTYEAVMTPTIQHVYSVESDKTWIDKLTQSLPSNSKCIFMFIDLKTNGSWGAPGKDCNVLEYPKYSDAIHLVDKTMIDMIFIDGRFRVACALKCLAVPNAYVLIDDFLNRKHYHIVLDYYDIIEKGKNLVVLKRKSNIIIPYDLISKYEMIQS